MPTRVAAATLTDASTTHSKNERVKPGTQLIISA